MNYQQPDPAQLHKHEEAVKKFFNKAQSDAMAISANNE